MSAGTLRTGTAVLSQPASGAEAHARGSGVPARWWLWLGLICAVALALRVGFVLAVVGSEPASGDPYQYHNGANLLVQGKGFLNAATYLSTGVVSPTAQHPPLYMMVLAIPSALGLGTVLDHRLWSCVLGTITVGILGLTGRTMAGPRVGLIAAGIAAIYPNLWIFEGRLAAETLSLTTVALSFLAAYRLWRRPKVLTAVLVGVACGLAALTRGEEILMLPLVAWPAALCARGLRLRGRLLLGVLAALGFVATVAPWSGFNLGRFDHPVLGTSTGAQLVRVGANCDANYYGAGLGYWSFFCIPKPPISGDETDDSRYFGKVASAYIASHESRLPVVVLARIGRTWGFFRPLQQVSYDIYFDGRNPLAAHLGLAMYYVLAVGSIFGVIRLRRSGVPVSPLLGAVVLVTVTVALAYGTTRFRSTAEPVLVLGAAAGAERLLGRSRLVAGSPGAGLGCPVGGAATGDA